MASAVLDAPRAPEDARTLAARAAESEGLGHWDVAARHYSLAFRASVLERDIAAAADALRGQARVRNHQRRFEEAEELAQLSLAIADRNGLQQAAARSLNVLGVIRYAQEDWAGARALYGRALDLALDLGDDDLAGLACQNAGVIANLRGDLREARMLYLESIGSFVRSGNSANAMLAYTNLGLASVYLGEWMEAEVYFSRGIEIGERLSLSPVLARLYGNRAHPLIEIGETGRARATLDQAEATARIVGDRPILSEVEKYRGMLARVEGRFADADAHLARAREIADRHATEFDRAEITRELARLREAEGRVDEARLLYGRSVAAFQQIGARFHERSTADRLSALGK